MSDAGPRVDILIVEDSPGVARSLSLGLGLQGDGAYSAETCGSGEDALQHLLERPADLLITDLRLPGLDGLTLLERARLVRPGLRSILITAFGSPEVEQRVHKLGGAYLAKPFFVGDLIKVIESVLASPAASPAKAAALPAALPALPAPEGEAGWRGPVAASRKPIHLSVLACDLDGTLGENGQLAPSTWAALRAARLAGMTIILVTGRTLDSVASMGLFYDLCEAIVAENGAVIYFPRRDAVVLPFGRLDANLLRQLDYVHVPLERGLAVIATVAPHDETLLRLLRKSRSSATLEYNREAVMLLPPGATKGSGLLYALEDLGYSPHNVVACGDGENDASLLEVAELGAAVANAQPVLRERADLILPAAAGAGVELLLNDLLEGRLPPHRLRSSRRLLLGHRASGSPVFVDPFVMVNSNLGIFGGSGSGKSWLAGLLAEQFVKQKYQVCIIDPEGDYRSLTGTPGMLRIGGPEAPLPPVADVLHMAEWNTVSLVLDLSAYQLAERLAYVEEFVRSIQGLRARRGRPHFFLVDEVQNLCPPEGGSLYTALYEAMQLGGFGLISYRPSQVAAGLREQLDHVLATRLTLPEELAVLEACIQRCAGGQAMLSQLPMLARGQACLCSDPRRAGALTAADVLAFRVDMRVTPHVRHLHKYLRAPLPEHKRFYFNEPGGRNLGSAANLWEFRERLATLPVGAIVHHLERGDFARWAQAVLNDEELARRLNKTAGRRLSGEALRAALLEVVVERYEELDVPA